MTAPDPTESNTIPPDPTESNTIPPDPTESNTIPPDPTESNTIRCLIFEVYEKGSNTLLFATTDGYSAQKQMHDGDRLVRRWWVQERPSDDRA